MNIVEDKEKLNKINAYLLIAFAFFLPLSVAIGNIIAGIIVIIWLLRGTFKSDWNEIKENKVVLAVLFFYILHIVGLLWTEDIRWGLHILKKETKFLLLPIFMLFVRFDHIKYYIYSFLAAMTLSEILSYGVWFEIIPAFKNATIANPTPFMSHVTYNPLLAFAIYLLLNSVLFDRKLERRQKIIYSFFVITMSINMFITGGRAGQVMYFAVLVIMIFQYFNKEILKSLFISFIAVPLVFLLAYDNSKLFKNRVDNAVYNTLNYSENKNTSMGERLTFWINSYEIIRENAIIGVGTGDFKNEYKIINQKNSPHVPDTDNPHNMYILELAQFGIIGLISLVSILFYQLKSAYMNKDLNLKFIGIALPLLFLLIMFSDCYLLGHYTSMLFIFFSSFLYKDYNKCRKVV